MTKMETQTHEAAIAVLDLDAHNRARRKRLFACLAALVLACAVGYASYAHLYLSRYVETDNAYTSAETAQVTPAVSGIVREVRVTDTQPVRAGDIIVQLDDTDARLAVAQAEAELGRAVRRVRGYQANDETLASEIAARASAGRRATAQVDAARADLDRAESDFKRRETLAAQGFVSRDELTRARDAFESARASLAAAEAAANQSRADYAAAVNSRAANAVLIEDATEQTNPEVALARAKLDQARVNLERTVIRAPVGGVVVKRNVQIGQQVQAGAPLLSIVPLAEVHVDANFKEGQLDRVRVGQPVELVSDLYGRAVKYHGKVAGLAGGTGSAFAAIPAQNATGNWIKVVQRLPVRIDLDPAELAARPLQVGLSMDATIDTRSASL